MPSNITIGRMLQSCRHTLANLKPSDNPHAKIIAQTMLRHSLALLEAGYKADDNYETSWNQFIEEIF